MWFHIGGLVQDSSNFIANALELLQSYTKSSIYMLCVCLYDDNKLLLSCK